MRRDAEMPTRFRRLPALAGLVAVLLAAGVAPEAGDDSPIQKIMEQVHSRNRVLGKALRDPSALEAAGRKRLAADVASLARLAREARTLTGPARERKKPQEAWTRMVDDFLRSSEELANVIADPRLSRPRAIQSYQELQKTCIKCHNTFRDEAN
jgi:cytochrome c556